MAGGEGGGGDREKIGGVIWLRSMTSLDCLRLSVSESISFPGSVAWRSELFLSGVMETVLLLVSRVGSGGRSQIGFRAMSEEACEWVREKRSECQSNRSELFAVRLRRLWLGQTRKTFAEFHCLQNGSLLLVTDRL
jgi:hypothetical protein